MLKKNAGAAGARPVFRRHLLALCVSQALAAGVNAATIPVATCDTIDLVNAITTANGNAEADIIELTGACAGFTAPA